MTPTSISSGQAELRAARRQSRPLYWFIALLSAFVNLLMLTGPLYMMQVYDRVMGSRSVATLLALTLLVAFLYGCMGFLDAVRGKIMRRVAARFQAGLDRRVFDAMVRRSVVADDPNAETGLADLEAIQRLLASPVVPGVLDLPFTPVFLFGITLFNPLLGLVAISGGVLLIALALLNQRFSRGPSKTATASGHKAQVMSEEIRNNADMIQAMGMRQAAFERWQGLRAGALRDTSTAADRSGGFTSVTKALRLLLQSAMLAAGAYLVLKGEMTPGSMIAGSILFGRALAPVEMILGQWSNVTRARTGWQNLAALLDAVPPEPKRASRPDPTALLEVQALTVVPPGESAPQLRNVSFTLEPGTVLGVVGPSGAGKSTLARALTGVWPPAAGSVRLDGVAIGDYDPSELGAHIGYLPQRAKLFAGTLTQNIARLSDSPDAEQVVEAAKRANAHEMIVKLPAGYDTRLPPNGGPLSGGQMQRVGLARALYGNPRIVILDEPNSNLDNDGSVALNQAVRQLKAAGTSVLLIAHRPAALEECDMLLVIEKGEMAAFGPREQVIKQFSAPKPAKAPAPQPAPAAVNAAPPIAPSIAQLKAQVPAQGTGKVAGQATATMGNQPPVAAAQEEAAQAQEERDT
uniref:RB119 n=1 Tax=Ruegeria sp. PR1b TaxID=185588 RepID=Q8KWC3_9RHOB|nr:type I secretion system permease/ATPase [Ruegeria sp. PR1b]AAN05140.1 RB119 [Ruegeria sp. PR1b]